MSTEHIITLNTQSANIAIDYYLKNELLHASSQEIHQAFETRNTTIIEYADLLSKSCIKLMRECNADDIIIKEFNQFLPTLNTIQDYTLVTNVSYVVFNCIDALVKSIFKIDGINVALKEIVEFKSSNGMPLLNITCNGDISKLNTESTVFKTTLDLVTLY